MENNKLTKNVPVFILAGGMGTRISEETTTRPKPMVEIGGVPILVHIMNYYYAHGFEDFVICAGYLSWEIKDYFLNYNYRTHGLMIDTRNGSKSVAEPLGKSFEQNKWRVRVLDTGTHSMTGARLARAIDMVSQTDSFTDFAVTYGDGLCDANLLEEFEFHKKHNAVGTVLGVPPVSRFGELKIEGTRVTGFIEKPKNELNLINGGFFFFKKEFRSYLSDQESCILERIPLETLVAAGRLHVYGHQGFWYCMDTLRDKIHLQKLWDDGHAPWVVREPVVAEPKHKKFG